MQVLRFAQEWKGKKDVQVQKQKQVQMQVLRFAQEWKGEKDVQVQKQKQVQMQVLRFAQEWKGKKERRASANAHASSSLCSRMERQERRASATANAGSSPSAGSGPEWKCRKATAIATVGVSSAQVRGVRVEVRGKPKRGRGVRSFSGVQGRWALESILVQRSSKVYGGIDRSNSREAEECV
jgi:hypothetical protein